MSELITAPSLEETREDLELLTQGLERKALSQYIDEAEAESNFELFSEALSAFPIVEGMSNKSSPTTAGSATAAAKTIHVGLFETDGETFPLFGTRIKSLVKAFKRR